MPNAPLAASYEKRISDKFSIASSFVRPDLCPNIFAIAALEGSVARPKKLEDVRRVVLLAELGRGIQDRSLLTVFRDGE